MFRMRSRRMVKENDTVPRPSVCWQLKPRRMRLHKHQYLAVPLVWADLQWVCLVQDHHHLWMACQLLFHTTLYLPILDTDLCLHLQWAVSFLESFAKDIAICFTNGFFHSFQDLWDDHLTWAMVLHRLVHLEAEITVHHNLPMVTDHRSK